MGNYRGNRGSRGNRVSHKRQLAPWERNSRALPGALSRLSENANRTLADLIRAEMSRAWPEGTGPALVRESVGFQVTQANALEADSIVVYDYEGIRATRQIRRRVSLSTISRDADRNTRERKLGEKIGEILLRSAQGQFENLPACYPAMEPGDRRFERFFAQVDYSGYSPPQDAMPPEEAEQIAIRVQKDNHDRLRQAILDRLAEGERSPWKDYGDCVPGTLVGMATNAYLDARGDLVLRMNLTLRYQDAVQKRLESVAQGFITELRRQDRTASGEKVRSFMENLLQDMEGKIRRTVPVAQISQRKEPKEPLLFHPALWQAMGYGCVGTHVRCNFLGENDPPAEPRKVFLLEENVFTMEDQGLLPEDTVSFNPTAARGDMDSLPSLAKLKKIPMTVGGRVRFSVELEKLWLEGPWPSRVRRPDLQIRILNHGEIVVSGKNFPDLNLNWHESTDSMEQKMLSLMDRIRLIVDVDTRLSLAQERVLSRLNPAQYAVLGLLRENPDGLTEDEIVMALENRIGTTQDGTLEILHDLTDERAWCLTDTGYPSEELFTEDTKRLFPLVRSDVVRSRYGFSTVYFASPAIQKGLFQKTKPRPFSAAELGQLTMERRENWLIQRCDSARTLDERWEIMNVLENQLTPQFAASFAKTKAGTGFFRSMEETDVSYVRYYLENLPGGEELADRLLGKGR